MCFVGLFGLIAILFSLAHRVSQGDLAAKGALVIARVIIHC